MYVDFVHFSTSQICLHTQLLVLSLCLYFSTTTKTRKDGMSLGQSPSLGVAGQMQTQPMGFVWACVCFWFRFLVWEVLVVVVVVVVVWFGLVFVWLVGWLVGWWGLTCLMIPLVPRLLVQMQNWACCIAPLNWVLRNCVLQFIWNHIEWLSSSCL